MAALLVADAGSLLAVQMLLAAAGLPLHEGLSPGARAGLMAGLTACQVAGLALAGAYRPAALFAGHREYSAVLTGLSTAALGMAVAAFLGGAEISRAALALDWVLSFLVLGPVRFAARRVVYRLRHRGLFIERVLVVGADAHGVALARQMDAPLEHGLKVAGFLDDYRSLGSPVTDGLAVLAEPRSIVSVARREGVSRVVVVPQALSWESLRDVLETAARDGDLRMQMAPQLHQLLAWSRRPVQSGPIPLIELEGLSIRGWDAVAKRVLDLALAGLLLPALVAGMAIAWVSFRVDGGGPLLRRRTALGRSGRRLTLLALAAPESPEPAVRLSRAAWRLRRALALGRWSKLPNLLNVLAGRMSLVGPRALPQSVGTPPHHDSNGQKRDFNAAGDAWLLALSSVRPGLTGPVAGNAEEQALHDVAYIRDYSIWLDLRLLFASARRALRRERALPVSYPAPALAPAAHVAKEVPWTS